MYLDNWRGYVPTDSDRGRFIIVGNEEVERWAIPGYFDSEFDAALSLYSRYKRWGLPFSFGWAEHPAAWLDLFEAFDVAYTDHQEKQNEIQAMKAKARRKR